MNKLASLAALLVWSAALSPPALADGARGDRRLAIYGLTSDQRLILFRDNRPQRAQSIGWIAGLSGDTRLVGIDFRPATGALVGLGDAGGVYEIDPTTATATWKSQLNSSGAPFTPAGASFGVDFNPTVDRLRVVSDTGQNLRVNVDTGAVSVDSVLTNAGAAALGVTGAAYTNNDADPGTATTLFDLDATLDQIAIQAPPNAGSLGATGRLGRDVAPELGFDIYSRLEAGTSIAARAFAALSTDRSRLYAIDLLSGAATLLRDFREGDVVIGLAVPPNQE